MSVPPPAVIHRKRRWPIVLGVVVGSVVVLYFVATSGAFIKGVVLPRVADALKSDLTVGDVSVSPLSSITLTDVKLTPKGAETLATIRRVEAHYSLWSIIRGTIKVDDATVDGAEINLVEAKDGTSNLSKLIDSLGDDKKPKDKTAPPVLDVHNVAVKNGTLHYRKTDTNGATMSADVSNLNVGLDQLANGKTGKLTLAADAKAQHVGAPPADAALHLGGAFDVALDDALLPTLLKGGLKVDLTQGTGPLQAYVGLGTALDIDLTGKEVKDLVLRFSRAGQELASIAIRGPFDLAKKEVRLAYEVKGLDKRVLSLVGAASGIDLGDATVGATGRVDVANGGNLVASNGRLNVAKLSLAGNGARSPAVDIGLDYKASVSLAERTALVEKMDLFVKQGTNDLVKGAMDRPMNLAWDKPVPGFRESTYSVVVAGFDLSQWRALLPTNAPTGIVRSDFKVTAEKDGQVVRIALNTAVDNLSASVGGSQIKNANATFKLTGTVAEFSSYTADALSLEVRQGRDQLLSVSGSADWRMKTQLGGVQLTVEGQLAPLLSLFPVPGVDLRAGVVKFSGQIAKRTGDMMVNANASVANVQGTVGKTQLADYQASADFSVTASGNKESMVTDIDIQRATLAAQTGFTAGGSVDVHGKYSLAKKTGSFDFKSINLNESALGPFVAPVVAPNKLLSVSLDLNGKADVNLASKSSAQIDLKVSNLRAEDPAHKFPATPLAAGVSVDVSQEGSVSDIRKFEIDLGGTARATNKLAIVGHIDLSTNKPTPTTVTIRSAGLDLTSYYDLLVGGSTNTAPAQPAAPASKPDPTVEPPPIHLPIRDLTADVDIARILLREVEVGALKGRVTAKDDHVSVDPFGFTINGAPVTTKVIANLGVPGYEYDVNFGAAQIPLAPLANSFVMDLKGLVQGTALATINLKGAGVTGANLKKNLGGLVLVVATNAQVRIPDKTIKLPGFLTWMPIIPNEINPGFVLGLIGKKSVLAEPIRTIQTRIDIAQGVAKLSETRVASPAILADVTGTIRIADIFTNSVMTLPVSVAIGGSGPLPAARNIGKAVGTIGKPKFDADPVAILALGAGIIPGGSALTDAAGGALNKLNDKTGGALGAVGNLISNPGGASTNGAAPGGGIGDAIGNLLGGGAKKTNAPAATPNTSKPINPLDLLPFGGKKK